MSLRPKNLPDGDCCSPWQKIMERLRELETGLSERVKKVKVNGQTIYPVNDGEIILPDYPESSGSVNAVEVDGTTYLPDDEGVVGLPDYPPDLTSEVETLDTELDAMDSRVESVEDDVAELDTAVTGLGTRMTTAESDIDGLDLRLATAEDDIADMVDILDTKANMKIDIIDPGTLSEGQVGDLWYNKVDDKLWKCASVTDFDYHWTEVGGGSGGSTLALHIITRAYIQESGSYVWKWTIDGERVEDASDVYDFLETLDEENLNNTVIKGYKSEDGFWYYNKKQSNKYYFSQTLAPDFTEKCMSFDQLVISSSTASQTSGGTLDFPRGTNTTFPAGAQTVGFSRTLRVPRSSIVRLNREMYDAYLNGDLSITPSADNVVLSVVNSFTLSGTSTVLVYRVPGCDAMVMIVPYDDLSTPVVMDFEKGGGGGGCDLNIIRHYRVLVGGAWQHHWYVNGSEVADPKAVYTYLTGLSEEELEKTIVKETAGTGALLVYNKTQNNRYYFNNVLNLSNATKKISFIDYYFDSNGYSSSSTNATFPSSVSFTFGTGTYNPGATYYMAKTSPSGVLKLPQQIYDAYINGDLTITNNTVQVTFTVVNSFTVTTGGQAYLYDVWGMSALMIVVPATPSGVSSQVVHF